MKDVSVITKLTDQIVSKLEGLILFEQRRTRKIEEDTAEAKANIIREGTRPKKSASNPILAGLLGVGALVYFFYEDIKKQLTEFADRWNPWKEHDLDDMEIKETSLKKPTWEEDLTSPDTPKFDTPKIIPNFDKEKGEMDSIDSDIIDAFDNVVKYISQLFGVNLTFVRYLYKQSGAKQGKPAPRAVDKNGKQTLQIPNIPIVPPPKDENVIRTEKPKTTDVSPRKYKPSGNYKFPIGDIETRKAIIEAAGKVDVPPEYLLAIASMESGMNPSVNEQGLFQFILPTWNTMVNKYGAKYNITNKTPRTDMKCNAIM